MKILAIDPSVNDLGWATYIKGKFDWGVIHPEGSDLVCKLANIRDQLDDIVQLHRSQDILICEYPNFQNSTRGAIAATEGYTLDLAAICAMIYGHYGMHSLQVYFSTPNDWKGTTPKDVIVHRFKKRFGSVPGISTHEMEAVMMIQTYIEKHG